MQNKIIITNLPAFYKIRLFNEVNKRCPLKVVFCERKSDQRQNDFYSEEIQFPVAYLSGHLIQDCIWLFKLIRQKDYCELIVGGWDNPLFWIACCASPTTKNSLIVESSDYESVAGGLKGWTKKLFLKRISKAYCSGTPHIRLLRKLGYDGKVVKTMGVGLPRIPEKNNYCTKQEITDFLYVGRLSAEKNLVYLIDKFNNHPELSLHICGYGPQEKELRDRAGNNIVFHGAVDNRDLARFYQKYDVLVLISTSEPWGLVVEEALNNGMPVLVSNHVGCREDLVEAGNGLVVNLENDDFDEKLREICDIDRYNSMRRAISKIDPEANAEAQIMKFVEP